MSKGNEVVLELKNVTKKFKTHNNSVLTACRDISLNFYKGETLGIVGESGCGKSNKYSFYCMSYRWSCINVYWNVFCAYFSKIDEHSNKYYEYSC